MSTNRTAEPLFGYSVVCRHKHSHFHLHTCQPKCLNMRLPHLGEVPVFGNQASHSFHDYTGRVGGSHGWGRKSVPNQRGSDILPTGGPCKVLSEDQGGIVHRWAELGFATRSLGCISSRTQGEEQHNQTYQGKWQPSRTQAWPEEEQEWQHFPTILSAELGDWKQPGLLK